MMNITINENGIIMNIGQVESNTICPPFINMSNFMYMKCIDIPNYMLLESWVTINISEDNI